MGSKPVDPKSGLENGDWDALDEFCNDFEIEEISLETWKQAHRDLDIRYPLPLTAAELNTGCTKLISYAQSIRSSKAKIERPEKNVIEISVIVPAGSHHEQILKHVGLGDGLDGSFGDLLIIITQV